MKKRAFDLLVAVPALLILGPVMLASIVVATIDTRQSGLFRQVRIGRYGRCFTIYKIRTMRGTGGSSVTTDHDVRLTSVGRWLRRFKLDEFPQLWNVVNGTMSLVGPRPDVPGVADRLEGDDRGILDLRPGITGPASLVFRHEQALLAMADDPESMNVEVLWPLKVSVNRAYLVHARLGDDLRLIALTLRPDRVAVDRLVTTWDPRLRAQLDTIAGPDAPARSRRRRAAGTCEQ